MSVKEVRLTYFLLDPTLTVGEAEHMAGVDRPPPEPVRPDGDDARGVRTGTSRSGRPNSPPPSGSPCS